MSDVDALRGTLPAYEFGAVLGRGAWGIVVAARHLKLNRDVAVKMLPTEYTQDPNVRQRFAAEARTLAALDHPHVVRIHDYVEDGEVCALVMERLTGGTLAQRMRLGPMPAEIASAIEISALYGLEHAHQNSVLHRDIKPENLMFGADGLLKITDFGIATVLGDQAERLTANGMAMGTPAYMAPEQLTDSASIGPATDIWSAGAVYYEMLCGDVPYPSQGTLQSSLLARARDEPRPLAEVDSSVPAGLAGAAMRALDRDVSRRWSSSGDFAEGLENAGTKLWGKDWLASTSVPVYRTKRRASSAGTAAVPTVAEVSQPRRKRTLLIAGAAVIVVAAGSVTAVLAGSGSGSDKKPTKPTAAPKPTTIAAPAAPAALAAAPDGWAKTMEFAVAQPGDSRAAVTAHFGASTSGTYTFVQDASEGHGWQGQDGSPSALALVKEHGYSTRYTFYEQRIVGRGLNNEVPSEDLGTFMANKTTMAFYWADVVSFLTSLSGLTQPISVAVDPPVAGLVESTLGGPGPASKFPVSVASSGVAAVAPFPNSYAGWTQAWIGLRNTLAPNVNLGMNVEDYGPGDFLVPTDDPTKRPGSSKLTDWAQTFGRFYTSLGAKYDYLNYTVSFGDHGQPATTSKNPALLTNAQDLVNLTQWVGDLSRATGLPVVLDDVPVGNTIEPVENNVPHHWQDEYAQLIFASGYGNLIKLRDAGVIGINFGTDEGSADWTCACDNDGNGVDDDGGYLQQQIKAYTAAGGLSLK